MIAIDGIIFSLQRQGGISVYFHKLLTYLQSQHMQVTLTLESPVRQTISGSEAEISVIRRRARLFERYRPCRVPPRASVFHSSYYRQPDGGDFSTVVTVHDFIYERFSSGPRRWVHTRQKHAAIRDAHAIICVSNSTREDLLTYVGIRNDQSIHVIPNGVADIFRPVKHHNIPSIPYVLYVGQRGGYKNFNAALRTMEFLPDFELHCVGDGPLQPRELAGVPDSVTCRVKHVGFVDDEALNALYNQAVCLVYPSSYEGFGIPVVEAMRAGCPVVCVECKAVMEVGGDALTIAEGLDPMALADAILKTVSSDRKRLIERGLTVAQAYSWEKTHAKTLAVYRSLVG